MSTHNTDDKVVRLDNPLGLVFDTPKSERNLRSSTEFGAKGQATTDERKVNNHSGVSSQLSYTVPISQVLG